MLKIVLPQKVTYLLSQLMNDGYEAYVVGGCVRDCLLGRVPKDWDITTSAKPEEVKAIFKRTVDTGIAHGTVTVMLEKEGFEVTTYRIDGEYEDNRHPKTVEFTRSLRDDLARRDFTINAMAYNETDGFVDLFGGLEDIKNRQIRCVGTARERFEEDALRILRAFRFSAQLDFEIEENTLIAAKELAERLQGISAERVREELVKLLLSNHPERLLFVQQAGITAIVLPEFDRMLEMTQENPHHCANVGIHSLNTVKWIAKQEENIEEKEMWNSAVVASGHSEKKCRLCLRLAALFHDVGKLNTKRIDENGIAHFYGHDKAGAKQTQQILQRLKFDNETIELVERLIFFHDYRYENLRHGLSQTGLRHMTNKAGKDLMELLFFLQEADARAQSQKFLSEKLEILNKARQIYYKIKEQGDCLRLKELAINGRDLIALGYMPGRNLGIVLNELLEYVLEHPEENSKEKLLILAEKKRRQEQNF